ncbi:MAG TPA: RNA polymerase sigma factor [Fimbriimonadaceae bacterium]|nr:RNA polymerase sigma factor [Fimbriimonadaceae bacterium]
MEAIEPIEGEISRDRLTPNELQRRYLRDVFSYISRRVQDEHEAEDVACDTLLAAATSLDRLGGTDPLLWLFGIARKKIAAAFRKRARQRERPLSEDLVAPNATDTLAERSDAASAIRRIVLALPSDQREALLLQHLEGLSIAEIAIVLGRSHAATNSLLERARARAYQEGKAYFVESES